MKDSAKTICKERRAITWATPWKHKKIKLSDSLLALVAMLREGHVDQKTLIKLLSYDARHAKVLDTPRAGTCRLCGCTDDCACENGCCWVNDDHTLCSACVGFSDEYLDSLDPKWISVAEALPDDEITVLIANNQWNGDPVVEGYHDGEVWHDSSGMSFGSSDIPPSHWMYLPFPPQESEVQP